MNLSDFLAQSPRGEARRLAKELGVLPVRIYDFKAGRRKPSLQQALALVLATSGKVPPESLRPDTDWDAVRLALRLSARRAE